MTNTVLFKSMIDRYNEHSFTHQYIWGFIYKGNVYMTITDSSIMNLICKLDRASRGAGYSLRFCPNTDQKMLLMAQSTTELICSKAYFDDMVANSKYNKGEIFEKMVTEKFGQVWVKDNIPYTDAGDIEVYGIAYQIKFEKATFTNEKSLARM